MKREEEERRETLMGLCLRSRLAICEVRLRGPENDCMREGG